MCERRQLTIVLLLAVGICTPLAGYTQLEPPFQRRDPNAGAGASTEALPNVRVRGLLIERQFFETNAWSFYHSLRDLPGDVSLALRRIVGSDVVGPGEPFDVTDAVVYPGRVQHLYTAIADGLAVVVWHSGGPEIGLHALIYDRVEHDACEYDFGDIDSVVLPLRPALRALVQYHGFSQGGCRYRSPAELQ